MAKKDLKVGDHVKFLRTHNKAVELTGTVAKLHKDGRSVDVQLDDHEEGWVETAHVDDVTVLESAKKTAKKDGDDKDGGKKD